MVDQALRRQINKIAKNLVGHDSRISVIERTAQAKFVSITDGSTTYYNADGEPVVVVGQQPDGTYTTVDKNGAPLLAPSLPIVTSEPGLLTVVWDGKDVYGGMLWPSNFNHVEVHVATSDLPPTDDTEVATFHGVRGGSITLSVAEGSYHVKLVAVNTSGVESAPTVGVIQLVDAVAPPGIQAYRQDSPPTGLNLDDFGSIWYDTDDGDKQYFWDGIDWVLVQDSAGARTNAVNDIKTLWGHPSDTTRIDGGDVYANSIRAQSLLLMDINNYFSDPGVTDAGAWSVSSGSSVTLSSGSTLGYLTLNVSTASTAQYSGDSAFWATEEGTEYQITAEYAGVSTNAGNTDFTPAIQVQNAGTTTIGHLVPTSAPWTVTTDETWVPFSFTAQIPAGGAKFRFRPYVSSVSVGNKVRVRNIKIRRKNSGSLIVDGTIEGEKLAANSVTADNVVAGNITGDKIASNALDAMTITGAIVRTAAAGARLELTASGLVQIDSSGNVILSIGNVNKFTGEIDATAMTIRDSLQLFGRKNIFATGSVVTLKASTSAPSVAPTMSWEYEAGPNLAGGYYWFATGVHSSGGVLHSATYTFLGDGHYRRADGKYWTFPRVAGTSTAEFKPISMVRIAKSDTGADRVVMIGEDSTHLGSGGLPEIWMRVYDDSTMNTSGTAAPILKAQWKVSGYSFDTDFRLGRHINGSGDRNKWVFATLTGNGSGNLRTLKWTHYGWNNQDDGYTIYSNNDLGAVVGESERLGGAAIGSRSGLGLETTGGDNATDFMAVFALKSTNAVRNVTGAVWELNSYWSTGFSAADRFWADGDHTAGTLNKFGAWTWGNEGDDGQIPSYFYTNSHKRVSTDFWVSYSWIGEVSSGFKTIPSPRANISYRSGARLRISIPALPAPIAGVGAARDPAKDVYGWQYYIAQNATNPSSVYLGPNNPTLAPNTALTVSSIIQDTFPTNTGTAAPTVSNFPATAPATVVSDNGLLSVTGDGDILARDVSVSRDLKIAGNAVGQWVSYTPSLVNWTAGTGATRTGAWCQVGNVIHFYAKCVLGTGFTVSSIPSLTLPVVGVALSGAVNSIITDTGSNAYVAAASQQATEVYMYALAANGAFAATSATYPFTWAAGDTMEVFGSYRKS